MRRRARSVIVGRAYAHVHTFTKSPRVAVRRSRRSGDVSAASDWAVMHTALAATATLLAVAFAMFTFERWLGRHRRHELVWTIALVMFALGSFGLWLGAAIGLERVVVQGLLPVRRHPQRALPGPRHRLPARRAHAWATWPPRWCPCSGPSPPASWWPRRSPTPSRGTTLPQGSAVFGIGPRIAAGVGSGVAATVIIVGAVWSAVRLLAGRRRSRPAGARGHPGRAPGRGQPGHRRRHARS